MGNPKDLKTRDGDIHIEKLPARLSIVKGDDGRPSLRIDPVYIKENNHPLLSDLEKTRLIREEIANIKKDYVDRHGNVQSKIIEYDKNTRQFVSFDPNNVKAPLAVNGEALTSEKRRKFQEGELLELGDGTQLQIRTSDRKGLRSNKTGLVLSVLIDGGISYLLFTGIQRLIGKKSSEQKSYSAGYLDAIKEVQKQIQRRIHNNPKDKDAVRDLNEAKKEFSRMASLDPDTSKPLRIKDYDDAKKFNSIDTEEGRNPSQENDENKGRGI